jgi:tetratricopeptide (TPR) repeat protein
MLVTSFLVQSARDTSATRSRDLLRRANALERAAIATEPENSYYYSNLGLVAASQALLRPPEATIAQVKAAFAEAVSRDSTNAEIMYQATSALMQLGAADAARSLAHKSATLYPGLAQPMAFFGYAALMERRWKDAADTLSLAVTREWWGNTFARASAWSNLSVAYIALGRYEEARRAAEESLQIDPMNADAQGNRKLAIEGLKGGSP